MNTNGTVESSMSIGEISFAPGGMFNIFATCTLTNKGWLMFGDKDKIWLELGNQKIVFDIKVATTSGTLYCMRFRRKEIQNEAPDIKNMDEENIRHPNPTTSLKEELKRSKRL